MMQIKQGSRQRSSIQNSRDIQAISCTIPLIREAIPLVVLFRALGCSSDKQILTRICFDCPDDQDMREALRPSLEEARIIQSQEDALDFIARRGIAQTYIKEKRIIYAKLLLETEFLPHVSTKATDADH
jgi:DNA-directed RNA polymerase II subunit RPB2